MPRQVHLVGIAGAGMRSLAGVLSAAGWRVSGSDSGDLDGLPEAFRAKHGHAADSLKDNPELVLYSPAIEQDHIELVTARNLGIPTISYPEMLGQLMQHRVGIAIAGTHGKSTVVAMVTSILLAAEADPLVVCGAECSRFGRGAYMVAEACEYRSSFLHLKPHVAVILNIEPDHFDYYRSPDHLEREFLSFAHGLDRGGVLITAADCPSAARVAALWQMPGLTFGMDSRAAWQADVQSAQHGCYQFRLIENGRAAAEIQLGVPGLHNVRNAIAAAAVAGTIGISPAAIARGLQQFTGLKRRLQAIGTAGGIAVIDDYAHHPTEIAAAIQAVRGQHPTAKITCIFEPHQANRTQSLRAELAASLQKADTLAVTEIFRAREAARQDGEITAADLAAQMRDGGGDVFNKHGTDEISDWILHRASIGLIAKGDVVLTLGAGRIGKLAHGIYQRIRDLRTNG
jgi:UDP-N-acetylmuramate--alanine ligase